jgi:thiol-disulfide isomerase/thioredoxin
MLVLSPACATHTKPGAAPAPTPPAAAPLVGSPGAAPGSGTGGGTYRPAPAPLLGHVTRDEVRAYRPWQPLFVEPYQPDPGALAAISGNASDVTMLLIVATWCPDSKREVPRFFKIYDQARVGMGKVTLVAVDRTKKDGEGLTVKYEILRVPTFVFFRGDREIGRVTERAITTLEEDIAAILTK